jgi:outer membrane receptor for ferrienterochelin and colicins
MMAQAPSARAQGMGMDEPGAGPAGGQQVREVVITGRRSLEERFMATGSMVVVDRQDIEQMGVDSVVDVLSQLPGLQVSTSASGSVEIRMRGLDSSATRVMIDGQRTAGRAQMPLDQLPADLIERIEIVRSPTAEFAGASGGTVNIVLRQANPQRSTTLRLTDAIAWDKHQGRLWASRTGPLGGDAKDPRSPPWSSFTGVWLADQLTGSDIERAQFTDGALSQRSETENRSRRQDWWLTQRLNGRVGRDQLALRGVLSGSSGSGRFETRSSAEPRLDTAQTQRQSWQLGSDWTRRLSLGKLETTLAGSGQEDGQERQGQLRFQEERQESTWQLKSKLTGARESLLWMAGVEHESRRGKGQSQLGASAQEQLSSAIERTALWGQNEWALPYKTTLTLGLRAESVRLNSAVDANRASQSLQFWQPSLHTRTPVGENAQWRLNWARMTRQPTVWDILDRSVPSQGSNSLSNPDTLGNPGLRPEVTQTMDIGWEQRLPGQGQFGLTAFARHVEDVIAAQVFRADATSPWVEQRQNIGNARTLGLEADIKRPLANAGWGRDWTLRAAATVLDSQLISGPREGQAIPGQPRYTGSLGLSKPMRRSGGYFGGASLTLAGPAALNTSVVTGRERARVTLDAHVGQTIARVGFWRLGVYNLGDAPLRRSRQYDNAGQQISETSSTQFAPRIFASVGTQF